MMWLFLLLPPAILLSPTHAQQQQCAYGTPNDGCPKGQHCHSGVCVPNSAVSGYVPPSKFEIKSLPGYADPETGKPLPLPSRQFTGYLDAGTPPSGKGTMYFHYWMIESESDPVNDPVLIWYNGGPGASSLFGMFQEWGPLLLTEDSLDAQFNATGIPSLTANKHPWTRHHTMIAIDSPPPMGLSFCSEAGPSGGPTSCGPWTDKAVFAANHQAHRTLFTKVFPELQKNPFFFTGESYAGIYVPGFARAMLDDPIENLNFQGWAVGDGWTGCKPKPGRPANWCIDLDNVGMFKYPNVHPGPYYDIEFFHGHSQISNELYRTITTDCPEEMLRGEIPLDLLCSALVDEVAAEVGLFFPYNLYNICPSGEMAGKQQAQQQQSGRAVTTRAAGDKHGLNRALAARRAAFTALSGGNGSPLPVQHESGVSSPCLGPAMNIWFAMNTTLEAIGAPLDILFTNLDNGHGFNYTSNEPFVGPIYTAALAKGKRVMVYEGDTDACGLQTSPVEDVFVEHFDGLGLNKTQRWRPWTTDGAQRMGGYTIQWSGGDARFVSLRGSGHLAPLNRPHATYAMIFAFTRNKPLPALVKPLPPQSSPVTLI